MTARIIDGKAISDKVLAEVAQRVRACRGRGVEPTLAVVLVGDDPASQIYVRNKEKRAGEVGIATRDHRLPADTTTDALLGLVRDLDGDRGVDGILVQLPLPKGIDSDAVLFAIDPGKDVDGFHPDNLGRLVIGRSTIVGKPMAHLLLQRNATVTIAHSRTVDLAAEVRRADVVVAAVGRAKLVQGAWLKPGAVVIDVGMNRDEHGKLCGDVDFESAKEVASAITPVPGGVGPMTIAQLLHNVVTSAERR